MKRRQLIQRSAGIGLLGVPNVKDSNLSTENSTRVVEVGFEHELDFSSEVVRKSLIQFAAEPPEYQVGSGDLVVTKFASEATKKALTTGDDLVDFDSLYVSPTGTLDAQKKFNAVTTRSSGLQPLSGVSTAESYAPPSIEAEFSPEEVTVTVAGESVTVPNKSEQRLELPSTDVQVGWHERAETQVSDSASVKEDESVSNYEKKTATATTTPVLRVRNNGVLNVKTGGAE